MHKFMRRLKAFLRRHRPSRIVLTVGIAVALLYGTIGFWLLEDTNWVDAFYWTVTTMSTVGYGDLSPGTVGGKIHAMGLMLMGVAIFGLVVEGLVSLLLEYSHRRQRGLITVKEKDHVLFCGWSETARESVAELVSMARPVFVLHEDETIRDTLDQLGGDVTYVRGDSTRVDDLRRAGIETASLVLIDLPTDSEALDAVITMRPLTRARIVVEVERSENQHKFRTAGADEMTMPCRLSGRLMAQSGHKRFLARFVTEVISTDVGMSLEEVPVKEGDPACGKTVAQLAGDNHLPDAYIVAVGRGDDLLIDTAGSLVIQPGDQLLCLQRQ